MQQEDYNPDQTADIYDENASKYTEGSQKAIPWNFLDKPALDSNLQTIDKDIKILDIGCGSGKVIDYLCERGADENNVTGVDISSELLKIARDKHPKAKFIESDIALIVLPQNTFDIVLAIRVLEYLSLEALAETLNHCYVSLKHGGNFLIIVGHPMRVNGSDMSTYQKRGIREHTIPGGIPIFLFHKTTADYLNAVIKAGFTIVAVEEPGIPEEVARINSSEYNRYASYGAVTLVLKLTKQKLS